MKITKIEIKDFHQFKDFSIDLTYPKGHEKEGKPLDKVCFIGQSGTGKTTLLELLPMFLANYRTNFLNQIGAEKIIHKIEIVISYGLRGDYNSNINFGIEDNQLFRYWFSENDNGIKSNYDFFIDDWQGVLSSKMIYFPANLNYELEVSNEIEDFNRIKIVDFSRNKVSSVWNIILEEIQTYQEHELKIRQDISKVVEKSSSDIQAIQNELRKLETWKEIEINPIKDIADKCLNPLLSNYKLRVKTELDFRTKEDIGFIKIEDFTGNEIPHGLWSTGTKQVVLSALPLYLLKPKHTIILFDEPERSLYPDLQRTIVDYYSTLTEDCQFFYSTHSPIIASSFEPWEIVELKFNNEGKVYRELYYEGENHVDNYKWNPKYMRWDDILQRIFDLEDDGSPERRKKLDELATLNVKYKKLVKQQKDKEPAAVELLEEITKLSKELSKWD